MWVLSLLGCCIYTWWDNSSIAVSAFLILQKSYGRMKNKFRIELALFVKGKCSEELQSLTTYFGKFFCPLATQAVSNDIIVGLLLQQVTCWRNTKSLEPFTPKELEKYSAVSLLGFIRLKKKKSDCSPLLNLFYWAACSFYQWHKY